MQHHLFATIATLIVFIGYVPLIKDALARKTSPSPISWLIWVLVTLAAAFLQIEGDAGIGAVVTIITAALCILMLVLSFRNEHNKVSRVDWGMLVVAVVAIIVWVIADEPILAIIMVTIADVVGFVPTIIKSWNKPHSETALFYQINVVRFIFAILALESFNALSATYPVGMLVANAVLVVILWSRRRVIAKS